MFLPPTLTGDTLTGSRDSEAGVVRDLGVAAGPWDTANLSFSLDADNPDDTALVLYVDGEPTQTLASSETAAGVANLADGLHTIAVYVQRPLASYPDRHGDDQGQRAYVTWPRATDTSVVAYRVYYDQGHGHAPDTLLTTVSTIMIERLINATVGTSGRASSWGTYTGTTPVNTAIVVTFDGTTGYTWACGELTGSGTFEAGESVCLCYGAWIKLHDGPTAYAAESTLTIRVGPTNSYLTGILTAGTYRFSVIAVDSAGNPSSTTHALNIKICSVLGPCASVTWTWDALDSFWTLSWTLPAGATGCAIYSNVDRQFSVLADHILTDAPEGRIPAASAQQMTWASGDFPDGVIKVYLRPYTAIWERRDLTIHSVTMPPTAADLDLVLGTPYNVTLAPAASGHFNLTWDYRWRDGDSASAFSAALTPDKVNSIDTISSYTSNGGYPVTRYTAHCSARDYSVYPITYARVAVTDANAASTVYSVWASGVGDSTAPTYDEQPGGAAQ